MSNTINNIIEKLFKNYNECNNFIFIYSPPKVGSTTLVSSLRISLGNTHNIIHIHDEIMLHILTGINNITINEIIYYLTSINKNVYVIDIYRTPIERKISEYFEKLSTIHFNNTEDNINNYSLEKIINRFNNLFPYLENGDHYHDKYNINEPILFDFNNKYTLQTINNINYIKLRLIDSNIWNNILSKIFNKDIIIVNDYLTQNKTIGKLYNNFKKEYKIPINFLDNINNCKYLNFYLNDEEKNNYINKWKNNSCNYFKPYTLEQFNFYINLSLENQFIDNIQNQHYIDEGCLCELCKKQRELLYNNLKNGKYYENQKITHNIIINENKLINKKKIINKINIINNYNKNNYNKNTKFIKNQFKIKLN